MNTPLFKFDLTITPILIVSSVLLIISIISLFISFHYWSKSFRPIVTAMVKTHTAGNLATTFYLEILNTGSIPAKNIQLKAEEKDINKALGKDSTTGNKTRWLSCFKPETRISILHNNSNIKCSFGTSKANDHGFWKYNAKIPITIEYQGWFDKKYTQNQDIQIIDSESFTGYQWG